MSAVVSPGDPFDVRRAQQAPELLRAFNDAGVLAAADVHVARRLLEFERESDNRVALAIALAVRAPRLGHVLVDLATIRETATVDAEEPVDLSALPWPEVQDWRDLLAGSGLVAVGDDAPEAERPLRLVGSWLYLDRYWREERQVAADLGALGEHEAQGVELNILAAGIARLFDGHANGRQALAAASAVLRRLAVVAGGPGTGKTTTVARIVALLAEQAEAAGLRAPLVALAAPTGKAAARLQEAVHDEARQVEVSEAVREQLLGLQASTVHRLLGWRPDSQSRFRHHRGQRLPHDVVIVDETSMVSLSLMAKLVEAIRPDARLVLVGDPGQLASIEAGAVLGDIVGPATEGLRIDTAARGRLASATGHQVAGEQPPEGARMGNGIVVLDRVHRFGGGIAQLAETIRRGDADEALEVLGNPLEGVTWIPLDAGAHPEHPALASVRDRAVAAGRAVRSAALAGAARTALGALASFRLLCAHRRGGHGVTTWTTYIESWLGDDLDRTQENRWYVGRPLLVTENDYDLQLYNGDTGVVIQSGPDRVVAAFERRDEIVELSPTRLSAVETVYAMTIHKSQGSQFAAAAVLLPASTSRILTRELLYTAATRAREQLIVVGTEETLRAAINRPVARASGLQSRLWGSELPAS